MNWSSLLRRRAFLISALVVVLVGVVWAATAIAQARPKTLDQRTDEVSRQILCPVCTNGESIAVASSAQAVQMRGVVKQKLSEGESEQQVLTYFRQRYGDAILVTPPFDGFTALIWLVPIAALIAGLLALSRFAQHWRPREPAEDTPGSANLALVGGGALSEDERLQLVRHLRSEIAAAEGLPIPEEMEET